MSPSTYSQVANNYDWFNNNCICIDSMNRNTLIFSDLSHCHKLNPPPTHFGSIWSWVSDPLAYSCLTHLWKCKKLLVLIINWIAKAHILEFHWGNLCHINNRWRTKNKQWIGSEVCSKSIFVSNLYKWYWLLDMYTFWWL